MIRLVAALALFLALHPAARAPAHGDSRIAAALDSAHPLPVLGDANAFGSALPARFTLIAPAALLLAPTPGLPRARGSRRWLLSSRLLL